MVPLLIGEGFECILIVALRNHCVFIRSPFVWLQNRHH